MNARFVGLCPHFWDLGQSTGCGGISKGNVIIQQVVHLLRNEVQVPPADKGFGCSIDIPKMNYLAALANADSYRCFANGKSNGLLSLNALAYVNADCFVTAVSVCPA